MKGAHVNEQKIQELLEAINRYWKENGYGPTYRDLQSAIAVSSTSVIRYWLDILKMRGRITYERYHWRSIRPCGMEIVFKEDGNESIRDAGKHEEPKAG